MRGGLFRRQFGQLVVGGDAARIDFADAHALALRLDVDGRRAIAKIHVDAPRVGGRSGIAPQKRGRRHVGREHRPVERIVDGDAVRLFFGRDQMLSA